MTQTDGKIYHALEIEKSDFSQWLSYPLNLQIQYNPYETANVIFCRTRTNTLNLHGNTEDCELAKQSWKRKTELDESVALTSDYTTKL